MAGPGGGARRPQDRQRDGALPRQLRALPGAVDSLAPTRYIICICPSMYHQVLRYAFHTYLRDNYLHYSLVRLIAQSNILHSLFFRPGAAVRTRAVLQVTLGLHRDPGPPRALNGLGGLCATIDVTRGVGVEAVHRHMLVL